MKSITHLGLIGLLALSASASNAQADDKCLLAAIKAAEPTMTVQQIKDSCALSLNSKPVDAAIVTQQKPGKPQKNAVTSNEEPAISFGEERMARLRNNSSLITPYDRNYILPFSYNDNPNEVPFQQLYPGANIDNLEVKFQLSIQAKIADNVLSFMGSDADIDLWGAYTQRSWWQLYNGDQSAPFRETNYEPELFFRWMRDEKPGEFLGFKNRLVSFGYTHQSNGRGTSLSRSWNRLFVSAEFDKDNLLIMPRLWWRIPESTNDDDNPDLQEYVGYGDVKVAYKMDKHMVSATLINNLQTDDNRGGVQLDWTFPFPWTENKRFKGYVQYYNGYGESLIDYNEYTKRLSVGVLLTDW